MRRKVVKVEKAEKSLLLRATKKIILYFLVAGISVGSLAIPIAKEIKDIKSHEENTFGYSRIVMNDFVHHQPNTFVLLDAGDYNTKGAFLFDKKIQYCNQKEMSVGIIVNEGSTSYNSIYRDVELAKSIIKNHKGKIDLPIFFNINTIIENYNLTSNEKTQLILTFLTKCESNGIFVGIYGTDKNLKRLKEIYENIDKFNACVEVENEESVIEYDGAYNYIKYANGIIKAKTNLSESIKKANLNSPERFISDSLYHVSKDEDIIDIAIKFNITPNDLLKFNKLKRDEIAEGTVLRIPSVLGKYAPYKESAAEVLEEPLVGADISSHQMNNMYNPDKLAENFDFIILKATEGSGWTDKYFDTISNDCYERNIPIGAYALSSITNTQDSIDVIRQKAEKQTEHFLNKIQNKKIEYPVYLDFEGDSEAMLINEPQKFKVILEVWYEKTSNAGYTPGLYMNQAMYKSMINSNIINTDNFNIKDNFEMWIAGGSYYVTEPNNNSSKAVIDNYKNSSYTIEDVANSENKYDAGIVQVTNVGDGKDYGAANHRGKLDLNHSYRDYTHIDIPEDIDPSLLEIIEPNQYPDATRIGITVGGLSVLLATGGVLIHSIKRKRKNR